MKCGVSDLFEGVCDVCTASRWVASQPLMGVFVTV